MNFSVFPFFLLNFLGFPFEFLGFFFLISHFFPFFLFLYSFLITVSPFSFCFFFSLFSFHLFPLSYLFFFFFFPFPPSLVFFLFLFLFSFFNFFLSFWLKPSLPGSLTNSLLLSWLRDDRERNQNPSLVWVGRLDFKASGLRGISDFQGQSSQCVLVWIDLQGEFPRWISHSLCFPSHLSIGQKARSISPGPSFLRDPGRAGLCGTG